MTPINNSDTAWLITADFNQDNNKFYLDLIEDINNPETNQFHYETNGQSGLHEVGNGLRNPGTPLYESFIVGNNSELTEGGGQVGWRHHGTWVGGHTI